MCTFGTIRRGAHLGKQSVAIWQVNAGWRLASLRPNVVVRLEERLHILHETEKGVEGIGIPVFARHHQFHLAPKL